ncbi:MAG: transcription elongation factor GreA [Oscillospiraceae bacterium]|nr:transcription elongation factor GreA [Oscillospiraceae bacterium]
MNKQIILTDEGLKKLENELHDLKTIRRKEIADKIKVALSFGDLSENSEYDEAKNEQAFVEARILQIENMLKNVKILDESDVSTEKVSMGCKVKVFDIEFDEEICYQIVSSAESNPDEFKISDDSPVGKALLSQPVGVTVEVEAPVGVIKLKILEITK